MSNNAFSVGLTLGIQLIEAGLQISQKVKAAHDLGQEPDLDALFAEAATAHQAALDAIALAKAAGH